MAQALGTALARCRKSVLWARLFKCLISFKTTKELIFKILADLLRIYKGRSQGSAAIDAKAVSACLAAALGRSWARPIHYLSFWVFVQFGLVL
jgi:hypothetical protein